MEAFFTLGTPIVQLWNTKRASLESNSSFTLMIVMFGSWLNLRVYVIMYSSYYMMIMGKCFQDKVLQYNPRHRVEIFLSTFGFRLEHF
jgi:hypothetical protein